MINKPSASNIPGNLQHSKNL